MTLRIPDEGEVVALSIQLGKTATENLILKLFSNNITPGESDTSATYTEVSGFGYAAVTLTAANWTITAGAPCIAAYPEVSFTFTGAFGNVYGYYIMGATSGKVRYAERFATAPFNVTANGDKVNVTLNISLQDMLD